MTKLISNFMLILLVLFSNINLNDVYASVSYKVLKDRKSQAIATSSIFVKTVIECTKQCTKNPECRSAHYKDSYCELLQERYSCISSDVQHGWKYIYMGKFCIKP